MQTPFISPILCYFLDSHVIRERKDRQGNSVYAEQLRIYLWSNSFDKANNKSPNMTKLRSKN